MNNISLEGEFVLFFGGHVSTESSTVTLKSPPITKADLDISLTKIKNVIPKYQIKKSFSVLVLYPYTLVRRTMMSLNLIINTRNLPFGSLSECNVTQSNLFFREVTPADRSETPGYANRRSLKLM